MTYYPPQQYPPQQWQGYPPAKRSPKTGPVIAIIAGYLAALSMFLPWSTNLDGDFTTVIGFDLLGVDSLKGGFVVQAALIFALVGGFALMAWSSYVLSAGKAPTYVAVAVVIIALLLLIGGLITILTWNDALAYLDFGFWIFALAGVPALIGAGGIASKKY